MNFEQRPEQRLEQKLNAQLILNLKLLILPINELEQLIENALEQNPALEEQLEAEVEADEGRMTNDELVIGHSSDTDLARQQNQELTTGNQHDEFSLSELFPYETEEFPSPVPEIGSSYDDEAVLLETTPNQTLTYRDTLLPKLIAELAEKLPASTTDLQIAEQLIEYLNPDGYLTLSEQELAEALGVEPAHLRRVLDTLRRIPPGGIGCEDVRHALLFQLQLKGSPPAAPECRIISEQWETLKSRNISKLAKLLGVSEREVSEAMEKILSLDPRPARQFTETTTPYVTPDLSIEWQEDRLVAVLLDDRIPKLKLSKRFLDIIQHPNNYSRDQVQFAREKIKNAIMFLRAIESRRRLLSRLAGLILEQQKDFFLKGVDFLKPLRLRDAAMALGVNASTISRAVSGKYIETPFGIFEMKFFFQCGRAGLSRASIKQKIKSIVDNEDKSRPKSDEEICAGLKELNIVISRRAVAKYRAELGIPGREERRRR
jgi:RNA polymerase sigma-54 factor